MELSLKFNKHLGNSAYIALRHPDFLTKINELFDMLRIEFLNDPEIKARIHKSVNVSKLLKKLAKQDFNALVIGKYNSWLILCTTAHPQHVIGTKRMSRVKGKFNDKRS